MAGEPDGALRLALPQHQDRGHLQVNETGLRSHLLRCLFSVIDFYLVFFSRDISYLKQTKLFSILIIIRLYIQRHSFLPSSLCMVLAAI